MTLLSCLLLMHAHKHKYSLEISLYYHLTRCKSDAWHCHGQASTLLCKSCQLAYKKAMLISLRSLHKAGPCIRFAILYGNADDKTMAVKWVSKLLAAQLVCAGTIAATNSEK